MTKATFCQQLAHGDTGQCWSVLVDPGGGSAGALLLAWTDKLLPLLISAALSAGVTFLVLRLNRRREDDLQRISRGRELRKVSMDLYREFFSEELAGSRYDAERYFELNADRDWRRTDPYQLSDPEGTRKGYAAVTRFWARVAILYEEEELDRPFCEKLLSRMAGYWWGLVYETMTTRKTMFTGSSIADLFGRLRTGSRSQEFAAGYASGIGRMKESARILEERRALLATSERTESGRAPLPEHLAAGLHERAASALDPAPDETRAGH